MTDDVERAMRREELLYRRELAARTRRGVVQQRVRVRSGTAGVPSSRDRDYWAVQPPSTGSTVPVTSPAAGEAR